jgi:hypothetical protein
MRSDQHALRRVAGLGRADAVHDRRDGQGADDQRVDEDREREAESEFLQDAATTSSARRVRQAQPQRDESR